MKIQMTYELAMAIGKDYGNRQMRQQGRDEWNAAKTVDKLLDIKAKREKRASPIARR